MYYLFWQLRLDWHAFKTIITGAELPMEILYFTLAAVLLYLAADWILKRIETASGKQLKYRNLIFFVILLVMAMTSFMLIQNLAGS
jgi:hypothetical protein